MLSTRLRLLIIFCCAVLAQLVLGAELIQSALGAELDETLQGSIRASIASKTYHSPSSRGVKNQANTFSIHHMTQVNKLHKLGLTGKGIKVAILDSGVDLGHPDLVVESYHNYNQDGSPGQDKNMTDDKNHGTSVAGVIAAKPNTSGIVGVSYGVSLVVYRARHRDRLTIINDVLKRAKREGASILSMSFGADGVNFSQVDIMQIISDANAKGLACIVAVGNSGERGLFYAGDVPNAPGTIGVTSFQTSHTPTLRWINEKTRVVYNTENVFGGAVSNFSSWGPTLDMEMIPSFGAPGGDVPVLISTEQDFSGYDIKYDIRSGTSLACPYIAGVYALLGELHGKVDSKLFRRLLSATASPQLFNNGSGFYPGGLAPVPQQGAGLVQVYKAATATATISPAYLSFNDTDSFRSTLSFTITRRCPLYGDCDALPETIDYAIGHVPALTAYTLRRASKGDMVAQYPPDVTADVAAKLNFSQSSVTLAWGERATVDVTVQLPTKMQERDESLRLPVLSGYITVNGSDGTGLSLPWQALAGSLRGVSVLSPHGAAVVLDEKGASAGFNKTFTLPPGDPRRTSPKRSWKELARQVKQRQKGSGVKYRYPSLNVSLAFASPRVRIFVASAAQGPPAVVAADADGDGDGDDDDDDDDDEKVSARCDAFGDHLLEIDQSARKWQPRGENNTSVLFWDGMLRNGNYVPPGTYVFVVTALRVRGNYSSSRDWDSSCSEPFTIVYKEPRRSKKKKKSKKGESKKRLKRY